MSDNTKVPRWGTITEFKNFVDEGVVSRVNRRVKRNGFLEIRKTLRAGANAVPSP